MRWYTMEHLGSTRSFVTPDDRYNGRETRIWQHRIGSIGEPASSSRKGGQANARLVTSALGRPQATPGDQLRIGSVESTQAATTLRFTVSESR